MLRRAATFEAVEVDFFDAGRHNETLALLASAALNAGRPDLAFMFADRRCRTLTPGARDYHLRAEASRRAGYEEYALDDLRRALEIDPVDGVLSSSALTWVTGEMRSLAAANFLAGESEELQTLALAAQVLKSTGDRVITRLRGCEAGLAGWVLWKEDVKLELHIHRENEDQTFPLERDRDHPLAGEGWAAAAILIEDAGSKLETVSLRVDGRIERQISAPARPIRTRAQRPSLPVQVSARAIASTGVDVIVPVHDDYEATKFCLACLAREGSYKRKRIIVVDDCSPNDRLRRMLAEGASRGAFVLIRNEHNLGFARAVNRALDLCRDNDVLLVNADAFLPPGVIDKLSTVAHSAKDIGAVTPLSNNGELTSFPQPNVANPLGPMEDVMAMDEIAWNMNGADVVDLPNGVGFCLYIKRGCLDAVGNLPDLYSRGYYEDVEFCLTAAERGWRNVCATGVFVGHAGAKSFKGEKRRLVLRNLGILEARFPEYRFECAAFLKADPLAPARARIEECLTPKSPAVLLVSASASARLAAGERARQIASADGRLSCIFCVYRDLDATAIFRGAAGGAPQTLAFSLSDPVGIARLRSYLEALDPSAVELFDIQSIPTEVLAAVLELPAKIHVVLADSQWLCESRTAAVGSCSDLPARGMIKSRSAHPQGGFSADSGSPDWSADRLSYALRRANALIPLDRMASAFASAHLLNVGLEPCWATPASRPVGRSMTSKMVVGILSPLKSGTTDQLLLALSRRLIFAEVDATIVVLGRCIDDLALMAAGNLFVTGAIEFEEYPRAIAQYEIGLLFSPSRTGNFWLLDALAQAMQLPKAYFEWSFGAFVNETGDLALDPRDCDEQVALEFADWLRDRPAEDQSP